MLGLNASRFERLLLAALFMCGLATLLTVTRDYRYGDRQYEWLARSFLSGRLDIDPAVLEPGTTAIDAVLRDGRYYWPLGPLPAVVLMPLSALLGTEGRLQAVAQFAAVTLAWVAAFALARKSGFGEKEAAWLTAAFAFGSMFAGVMYPLPWYLANVIAVLASLAALLESRGRDRPEIVGAFVAAAFATRLTAGAVAAVYFLVREALAHRTVRERVMRIVRFSVPVAAALLALGWYDAARFGSPFDNGYRDSLLNPGGLADDRARYGIFNLHYVMRNVYLYLFAPPALVNGIPVPDKHGYSLLLMAPVFLWMAAAKRRMRDLLPVVAATAAGLAIYLPFYSNGASELGPRYLNDLLPFWFALLIAVFGHRGLGRLPKAVIAVSGAVNLAFVGLYAFTNFMAFR